MNIIYRRHALRMAIGMIALAILFVAAAFGVSDDDYFTTGNFATSNTAITTSYPVDEGVRTSGENISNTGLKRAVTPAATEARAIIDTPIKPMENATQTAIPTEKTAGFEVVLAITTISAIYILVQKRG